MWVVPGPGEPAEPVQEPAGDRPFREVVDAWLDAGGDGWWRVRLVGLPAGGDRSWVSATIRGSWRQELEYRRTAGYPELTTGPDGRFIASLVHEDGEDWLAWGPRMDATPSRAGNDALGLDQPFNEEAAPDIAFVEDGGDIPDYWRDDHEAAEAEIAAGLGTFFEDDDAFDQALDEVAAHPRAS